MTGLLSPPATPRRRTSQVLAEITAWPAPEGAAFATVVDRLGDRTYGLLLLLLATINLVPLANLLAGPAIAALGLQMALGVRKPWLPQKLLVLKLSADMMKALQTKLIPAVIRAENYLRPRWLFSEAPIVDRLLGLLVLVLGLIIMIPAPLTNLPPSLALILIGLGLTERDGLVQLLGAVLAIAMISLLAKMIGRIVLALI